MNKLGDQKIITLISELANAEQDELEKEGI